MSDTRLADILDALHDLLIAEAYIAAEIAAERLKAFDGPPTTDFSAGSMLCTGATPTVDDEVSSTTVEWDWGSLGVSGQFADVDEWVRIPCGITAQIGDSTQMRAVRRTAINIYAKAAAAIRNSTLSIPQVMWCVPSPGDLTQLQTPSGAEVLLSFTANIRTRI